jgi:signal transduction histidine kinase
LLIIKILYSFLFLIFFGHCSILQQEGAKFIYSKELPYFFEISEENLTPEIAILRFRGGLFSIPETKNFRMKGKIWFYVKDFNTLTPKGIQNQTILYFSKMEIDKIKVHIFNHDEKIWTGEELGRNSNWKVSTFFSPRPIYRFPEIKNNIPIDLLLEIEHYGYLSFFVSILDEKDFNAEFFPFLLINGILKGIVFLIIFYNILNFIRLKNKIYIIFILYIFTSHLNITIYEGTFYYIFPVYSFDFIRRAPFVLHFPFLIFSLLTTYYLLKDQKPTLIRKITVYLIFQNSIMMVVSIFVEFIYISPIMVLSDFYTHTIFFAFTLKEIITNRDRLRLFYLSRIASFVVMVLFILYGYGYIVLESLFLFNLLLATCFIVDYLLLTFAIKDHYYVIRKEKEDALAELSQSQIFLSHLSHQLRTPLTNFKIVLDLLNSNSTSNEDRKAIYQSLNQTASLGLDYMDRLMWWNQLRESSYPIQLKLTPIREVVIQSISSVSGIASIKEINIKQDIPQDIEFNLDPGLFSQVMINFLMNSIHHSPQKSTITIHLDHDSNLKIHDEGRGFTRDQLTDWRTAKESTSKFIGKKKGIGLLICKEILRLHQMDWEIDSNEESGTTIIISLPKLNF